MFHPLAIAVAVIVVIIVVVALAFSTGFIQLSPRNTSTSTLAVSAINNESSAVPANTLFQDYQEYPNMTTTTYTHQWIFLSGNVSSVQNQNGNYMSCVNPSNSYFYGCSYATEMMGWIVWTWDGSSQASSVPVDTNFVAECYVTGMNAGDLDLSSCVIVQS